MSSKKGKTIALDFDGVIHQYKSAWTTAEEINDPPTPGAKEAIRSYLNAELKVVIFSARARSPEGVVAIKEWLKFHDFPRDLEITAEKPAAILYVDDRAYSFVGHNFPTLPYIEAFVPWNRRG